METIFMNTENSKTNELHRFMLALTDKLNLKYPNKNMTLVFIRYGKILNLHITTINSKYLLQPGIMNLVCLMDHILLRTFKIIFENIFKNHETITNNIPVQISTNKIRKKIVFKINTDYKLELLSPETIKLLGSTKEDVDQNKVGEVMPK